MKTNNKLTSILLSGMVMLMLNSCSKSDRVNPGKSGPSSVDVTPTTPGHHKYGLLATSPEEYGKFPVYSKTVFDAQSRSSHSRNFSLKLAEPAVLTLTTPAVRDQGQIGSCTGFCGTEAYEILWYYKNGSFPALLSPLSLYYEERVDILGEDISDDNGANMVNIDQAFTSYGICTEALYAYPANDGSASDQSTAYLTAPSSAAVSNALNYTISNYTLINTGDTAAVKNCLRNNIPVMMGLNIYDKPSAGYPYFEGLSTTSNTYNPLTSSGKLVSGLTLMGGHATPIIGYDDTKKAFLVQNSWGSGWGNNGFYYMPYSVFKSTKIVPQGGVYYATL